MRTSSIIVGILGGVAVAAVLIPPLYIALPARYLVSWYFMTSQGALGGMAGALVLWLLIGFVAGFLTPEEPVRSGTAAGLLASLLGGVLMVLPAAAVEACSDLVIATGIGRTGAEKLATLTAAATLRTIWLPSAGALALLCLGPSLGAVGGVGFDLWRGSPGRPGRDLHHSLVPVLGILVSVVVGSQALWALAFLDGQLLPALGRPVAYLDLLMLTAPLGVLGLVLAGCVSWAGRDVVVLFRSARRLLALGQAMVVISLPPVLLISAGVLFPRAFLSLWTWLGIVLCGLALLVAPIAAMRSDDVIAGHGRSFGQVIADALLAGLLVVSLVVMGGGASALAGYLMISPYASALLQDAPLVSASPERLVGQVFAGHWAAGASIFLLAGLWLAGSVPVWLVGRAISARRD